MTSHEHLPALIDSEGRPKIPGDDSRRRPVSAARSRPANGNGAPLPLPALEPRGDRQSSADASGSGDAQQDDEAARGAPSDLPPLSTLKEPRGEEKEEAGRNERRAPAALYEEGVRADVYDDADEEQDAAARGAGSPGVLEGEYRHLDLEGTAHNIGNSEPPKMCTGRMVFPTEQEADFICPHVSTDPTTRDFVFSLLYHWDLTPPKLIISVLGGSNDFFMADNNRALTIANLRRLGALAGEVDEDEKRLHNLKRKLGGNADLTEDEQRELLRQQRILESRFVQLFSRGIGRAACRASAWLISGGISGGVMRLTGLAARDSKGSYGAGLDDTIPTIGFETLGSIRMNDMFRSRDHDGEPKPAHIRLRYHYDETTGKFTKQLPPKRDAVYLDPNHSHHVMVDTSHADQHEKKSFSVGEEVQFRSRFEEVLCSMLPGVVIVANGDRAISEAVVLAVRQGRPIIIIKGSGGFADEIAELHDRRMAKQRRAADAARAEAEKMGEKEREKLEKAAEKISK